MEDSKTEKYKLIYYSQTQALLTSNPSQLLPHTVQPSRNESSHLMAMDEEASAFCGAY